MAADHVVYCLEKLTDYVQFERLCHDIMFQNGYKKIEPLGGHHDKGRDAIHCGFSDSTSTIFAYSVREDWRRKLLQDCETIRKHDHLCQRLVFLCTATFSATDRDDIIYLIQKEFAWELELWGIERIAVVVRSGSLTKSHPQIFSLPQASKSRWKSIVTWSVIALSSLIVAAVYFWPFLKPNARIWPNVTHPAVAAAADGMRDESRSWEQLESQQERQAVLAFTDRFVRCPQLFVSDDISDSVTGTFFDLDVRKGRLAKQLIIRDVIVEVVGFHSVSPTFMPGAGFNEKPTIGVELSSPLKISWWLDGGVRLRAVAF